MCLSLSLSCLWPLYSFLAKTTASFVELYSCVWLLVPFVFLFLACPLCCVQFLVLLLCVRSTRLVYPLLSHLPSHCYYFFFHFPSLPFFLSFPSKLYFTIPSWVPRSKLLKGKAQDSACDHFPFLPCPLSSSTQPNQPNPPTNKAKELDGVIKLAEDIPKNIE